MFRFFLFLKGYYRIKAEGVGTERFINLCKIKNIYLWDLSFSQDECKMNISIEDYDLLSEILNKTGVKVDILKKYGLPFFFFSKKSRGFYILFVVMALLLIFISNCFVWNIHFEGNYSISDEQLEDFLEKYEVSIGTLKNKIPYSVLEEELRKQFTNIKWCSASLLGNTLTIHIKENSLGEGSAIESQEDYYSDIVAQTDGVVKTVLVRNGLALVKPGDKVLKGQILVTGAVPIYDDALLLKTYHYYEADADVLIETSISYEDSIDEIHFEKEYTGRTSRISYLKIYNLEVHMPYKKDYAYFDTNTSSKQLIMFGKIVLPIYYGVYNVKEYYRIEKEYSKEKIKELFNKNLSNYYKTLSEKGVQILEKNVKIEHNADKWVLKGDFKVSFQNTKKEYKEKQLEITIP